MIFSCVQIELRIEQQWQKNLKSGFLQFQARNVVFRV